METYSELDYPSSVIKRNGSDVQFRVYILKKMKTNTIYNIIIYQKGHLRVVGIYKTNECWCAMSNYFVCFPQLQ